MVVLNDEMGSLIALEFGYEPHVDASAAFDLFPQYPLLTFIFLHQANARRPVQGSITTSDSNYHGPCRPWKNNSPRYIAKILCRSQ
jgi:hypothetical protein